MNREILEGNKLIAEFMGADYERKKDIFNPEIIREFIYFNHNPSMKFAPSERRVRHQYTPLSCSYHHSWDWLMPVVERIEKHGCIVEIWLSGGKGCRITKVLSKTKSWTAPVESNNTIEAVYTAVVEFIKYHNSKTPPTNE